MIKQVSVFVENKQGKLSEILAALAAANIDLRAMSIADTADFGVLRLICDEPDKAKALLTENDCIVSVNDVVGISVPDSPGGLADVLKLLAEYNMSIEYIYAYITHNADTANIIMRFEDNEAAAKILADNNVVLL